MNLSAVSVPAQVLLLLRRAYVTRQSGHLHVTRGEARRGLAVRDGHIVHGRSSVSGERLSDVLVRHGFVGEEDCDRALAKGVASRRPIGAALKELGLIDRERLEEAVAWHVRDVLFAALDEPGSTVEFEEIEALPEEDDPGNPASRLSTGRVLLEAVRRLQDPAVVHEALGEPDRKLVLAHDPRRRAHPVALTPADGFVLSRVDGTLNARELVDLIPLPPEETEKSLLGLLCTGAVDFAPEAAPPAPEEAPASAEAPAPSPADSGSGPGEVRQLILEAHARLAERDHFAIFGLTPAATAAEVRTAYVRLARTLHPDACRHPLLAELDDQREEVFLRVCAAYETLRDPEERARYEEDLRRRKPAALAPSPSATAPAPHAGPARPERSLEERLEEAIATGEELVRDGQPWEAIRQLEPTLRQAQGALRIRARLALARANMKNPEWLRRAEAHLLDVLHEDPAQLEAYLLLGDIYKASRLRARATTMYRKALDLEPENRHARRELARLEGAPTPASGTAALLGFLKRH